MIRASKKHGCEGFLQILFCLSRGAEGLPLFSPLPKGALERSESGCGRSKYKRNNIFISPSPGADAPTSPRGRGEKSGD